MQQPWIRGVPTLMIPTLFALWERVFMASVAMCDRKTMQLGMGVRCVADWYATLTVRLRCRTGWYDGQVFVKPPEVLARDRLVGTYEVNPIMKQLRTSMLVTGGGLILAAFLLVVSVQTSSDADGVYGRGAARTPVQVRISLAPC